jgi:hypothetical protein
MKTKASTKPPKSPRTAQPTGSALWRCNKCQKVETRELGWKTWTKSFCEKTGKNARLYRISAPSERSKAKKIQALRTKRDNALIDAKIASRRGKDPSDDRRRALQAAIAIDKARGLY